MARRSHCEEKRVWLSEQFSKYVIVHGKKLRNDAEGCVTGKSLALFSAHAVEDKAASEKKYVWARRSRRGTTMMGLRGSWYREVLCGDGMLELSVLKTRGLMAAELLRQNMMRDRVARFEVAQQAAPAGFQTGVEHYKGRGDRGDKKDRADCSASGVEESSLEGLK